MNFKSELWASSTAKERFDQLRAEGMGLIHANSIAVREEAIRRVEAASTVCELKNLLANMLKSGML